MSVGQTFNSMVMGTLQHLVLHCNGRHHIADVSMELINILCCIELEWAVGILKRI